MTGSNHFDVIIIGAGAGGGTLARRLAPSGKRVLLLERGGFVAREVQNWDNREVWVKRRYMAREKWFDDRGRPFRPETYYNVGGNTKMYGAALYRFRKEDFGDLKHHGGLSPAWPISYDDLEPYYAQAERLYHVHGERGIDPTEPPASGPFPHPPISHEPRIQEICDGFTRAGCHPFPMPMGVMLDEKSPPQSRCIRCDTCDGHPCLVLAKADADVVGVRPALEHPNVSLHTHAEVLRLNTSPSGREVTEVVVRREGQVESFSADVVVLSAGAVNSVRILLASANAHHPRGLANGSDQVGRNLMRHNLAFVMVFTPTPNPTRFQKTLSVNDFYLNMKDFGYPAGHIQMFSKSKGEEYQRVAPRCTPHAALDFAARHAVDFLLITEDLPDPDNRVSIRADGGVQVRYRANNLEAMRRLRGRFRALLTEIGLFKGPFSGFSFTHMLELAALGHQNGTCRAGHDPRTSVLDPFCKAHELDNLYVVDASFFPSSAAVNPSLTIYANALRVGDHILERLG